MFWSCVIKYDVIEIRNVLRELMLMWLPLFKRHKDRCLCDCRYSKGTRIYCESKEC